MKITIAQLNNTVGDIDGNIAGDGFTPASHGIRVNDMVLLASAGKVSKCLVVETPESAVVSLEAYDEAVLTSHATGAGAATYWLLVLNMVKDNLTLTIQVHIILTEEQRYNLLLNLTTTNQS